MPRVTLQQLPFAGRALEHGHVLTHPLLIARDRGHFLAPLLDVGLDRIELGALGEDRRHGAFEYITAVAVGNQHQAVAVELTHRDGCGA